MHFKINLASRSYINRRQFNAWVAVIGAVLAVLLLLNIRAVAGNAGEITAAARQIGMYNGTLSGAVPEKEYQAVLSKIKFANEIIDRKTFKWTALLDRLEETVPDGVAISALEPNIATGEVRIGGVARNFNSLRTLMESMEGSTFFRDVFLVNQGELTVGKSQKGVTFSITCKVRIT